MTSEICLPYGRATVRATLRGRYLGCIDVADVPAVPDSLAAVDRAMAAPEGLEYSLTGRVRSSDSVTIVVSDSFRQTRADVMLPPLLDALGGCGVADDRIRIVFSTGTHRAPTVDEQRAILSAPVFDRFRHRLVVHDAHDAEGHAFLGTTSRGTPVEVNRLAVDCDRLFVTGATMLHYFGGFGGGRKSIVPGLASARTIAHNHVLNLHPTKDALDPDVRIGSLSGNPVAEDMLEASQMVRVEGIVNTVLTKAGDIAGVFAGGLEAAHLKACAFAHTLYAVPIEERADLVIAASPHTKNYVQTHKALFNAWQALRPGGRIVLAAPCAEGLGGDQFAKWLDYGDPHRIIAALRRESDINGQTALSTKQKAPSTFFVTDLPESDVVRLGGVKADSLQVAIDNALDALGTREPSCVTMPNAAYSVPMPR